MSVRLGVVMDPIQNITVAKDSTLAILLAAQARQWQIHYMELNDLYVENGKALARVQGLSVEDHPINWFILGYQREIELNELDVILMRKDPPFNLEYIYATYILELAEKAGALVVNKPQSLRDANEKFFISHFMECTPPTLISRNIEQIAAFINEQEEVVLKPLDGMGGRLIFRLSLNDPNTNVAIEALTQYETRYIMAQRYIPEISLGDKRVLLIDGTPLPYALARIPPPGDSRGNLAVGAKGVGQELSERDRWICERVGPSCRDRGLIFVGLDIIGDYLSEINVTSPTCIRELDAIYDADIAGHLLDAIATRLDKH